jgi:uncharacterized protein YqeY
MTLIERIGADMITAYKERNSEAKALLGLLKAEATKVNKVPSDAEVVAAIKSLIKTNDKSVEEFDTPILSVAEIQILDGLLPKQLTEDELTKIINGLIVIEALTGPKDMGKVMKYLKENHGGEYDGKLASTITQKILKDIA